MNVKPPLKWAGSKRKLVPELRARMPEKWGRYFEPFFGGGSLFFDVLPAVATINDVNLHLVHTYRTIVRRTDELIAVLKAMQAAHQLDEEYYGKVRAQWNEGGVVSDVDHAAKFIYLNKTCFNGLYRVNLDGKFNVPKGRYKNPGICNAKLLYAAADALDGCQFHSMDFEEATSYATRDDFVYFDPPYVPASKTANFTSYDANGFGVTEQHRLADHARTLTRRGVKVMLSNSDTRIVRELYEDDFHIDVVMAGRAINSKATGRGKVREVIIRNYT